MSTADVFLSAAPKPMDELAGKGLILPDTRRDLVRNELVLIVSKGATRPTSFRDLTDTTVKVIALGDPGSVPAGDYGRLQALGVWAAVQPKLVLAKDVRQVLTYVEGGNAEAGLVYATDAREHAEALLSGYELLQLLHDRGVLNLLRGLAGGGNVASTSAPNRSV